mgnify:CR=1 FL=1
MEELCQKDGGINGYETVTLPASDFSNNGQPLTRYQQTAQSEEEPFGPGYKYVVKRVHSWTTVCADRGEGRLTRWAGSFLAEPSSNLTGHW